MGNAVRDSSGFAASGTCNYADRPKQGLGSKPLVIIKFR